MLRYIGKDGVPMGDRIKIFIGSGGVPDIMPLAPWNAIRKGDRMINGRCFTLAQRLLDITALTITAVIINPPQV